MVKMDEAEATRVGDTVLAAPEQALPHFMVISQVKSDRVVYFTDDPEFTPTMDGDWYYVSSYLGKLPEKMSLRNCWRWRFRGGVFIDAGQDKAPAQAKVALIEHNRQALKKILEEKINLLRAPFMPSCSMGEQLRLKKLAQAQAFLSSPDGAENYSLLQAVALARRLSMQEMAELILTKATQTEKVLLETEAVRESLTQALVHANTEQELMEIRKELLDQVYPELSGQFKFKIEHAEPPKLDVEISEVRLEHEKTRLQVQLREKINKVRAVYVSQYLMDDLIVRQKAKIAEAILANPDKLPEKLNTSLLEPFAQSRDLTLPNAARVFLEGLSMAGKSLLQTEKIKEAILKQIATMKTPRDLKTVSATIDKL